MAILLIVGVVNTAAEARQNWLLYYELCENRTRPTPPYVPFCQEIFLQDPGIVPMKPRVTTREACLARLQASPRTARIIDLRTYGTITVRRFRCEPYDPPVDL